MKITATNHTPANFRLLPDRPMVDSLSEGSRPKWIPTDEELRPLGIARVIAIFRSWR